MSRRVHPPGINDDIARMLAEGTSVLSISKALGVGQARVRAVRDGATGDGKADTAEHAEVEAGDVVFGEPDDDNTVSVDADYLRALEALLFVVEQNRALRAAMEAA